MSIQRQTLEEAKRLVLAYSEAGEELLVGLQGFSSRGGWESAFRLTTAGLTTKAHCTAQAIVLLLSHELVGEAQVLMRVLVELAVIALAIGREPERRAPLYVNYQHITKYRWWKRAAANVRLRKALFEEDPRGAGRLQENYDRHAAAYGMKNGRVRAEWHEESSAQLAREVGLGELWDAMYGIDSALVHSGPECLALYLRQPRPRQLEIGPMTGDLRVMRVLLDVTTCMQHVLDHFVGVFPSADGRQRVEQLRKRRDALFSRDPL